VIVETAAFIVGAHGQVGAHAIDVNRGIIEDIHSASQPFVGDSSRLPVPLEEFSDPAGRIAYEARGGTTRDGQRLLIVSRPNEE